MEFNRHLLDDLVKWKEDVRRKPLILHGARQVGKTWLLKKFGERYFDETAYFNFDEQADLAGIFSTNKDPHRIMKQLSYLPEPASNPGLH